ncbi:hypothetical protein [Paenibacillus silviterrae]|nr:hypothetical protein [Paenibacillus chinjuensis]
MKQEFCTKVGSDVVGLYLTGDGPRMVINREEYELTRPCWDLEMVMGQRHHVITFYWRGEVKLSVRFDASNDVLLKLFDYLSYRTEKVRYA